MEDPWERSASNANAGYGTTAVLEGGALLEKVPSAATCFSSYRSSVSFTYPDCVVRLYTMPVRVHRLR